MSQELKSNKLNSLYAEYRHRFRVEFEQLLEAQTFAEAIFQNHDVLFRDPGTDFVDTLAHCLESTFEKMALGLARVWEGKAKAKPSPRVSGLLCMADWVHAS